MHVRFQSHFDEYINEGRENAFENTAEDVAHRQLMLLHPGVFQKTRSFM